MPTHARDEAPGTAPIPAVKPARKRAPAKAAPDPPPTPDPPVTDPDIALRNRLVAVLRPTLTLVVARMYVDRLLPEVKAYAEDAIDVVLAEHAALVGDLVASAQDCLDILGVTPA